MEKKFDTNFMYTTHQLVETFLEIYYKKAKKEKVKEAREAITGIIKNNMFVHLKEDGKWYPWVLEWCVYSENKDVRLEMRNAYHSGTKTHLHIVDNVIEDEIEPYTPGLHFRI